MILLIVSRCLRVYIMLSALKTLLFAICSECLHIRPASIGSAALYGNVKSNAARTKNFNFNQIIYSPARPDRERESESGHI